MTTVTGDESVTSSSDSIAVILLGDKGQGSPCVLRATDPQHKPFQPGATDKFKVGTWTDLML